MPTPSPEIQAFAAGFPIFLLHTGVTVAILLAAAALYILLTPHKEITLIREGNAAAAVSLAGVLIGLAIPLAASLKASTNVIEIGLWGAVTVVVQPGSAGGPDSARLPKRIRRRDRCGLLVGAKIATASVTRPRAVGDKSRGCRTGWSTPRSWWRCCSRRRQRRKHRRAPPPPKVRAAGRGLGPPRRSTRGGGGRPPRWVHRRHRLDRPLRIWMTARHVVDGCSKVAIVVGPARRGGDRAHRPARRAAVKLPRAALRRAGADRSAAARQ